MAPGRGCQLFAVITRHTLLSHSSSSKIYVDIYVYMKNIRNTSNKCPA